VADELWKPYADAGLDETTARVYGMVENVDTNLGLLLDKLGELHLRGRTYVVLLSDNGPQQKRYTANLRGRKSMNYEGGVRALSFWNGPGVAPKKVDRIAAHIDLFPTLLDLAQVPSPASPQIDGVSLRPLLEGRTESWPERTHFSQVHRGLEPKRYQNAAVQTDRWKLVLGPETFNDEDWTYKGGPPLELYDLQADPGEERDQAGGQLSVVADLRARYESWFDEVESERRFTPGVIHLGSDAENPAVLCRYQDSTFVDGKPTTWSVEIERADQYRFTVNTPEAPGSIHVLWQGEERTAPGPTAEFEMTAGSGPLDVWFQPKGAERHVRTENNPLDDVTVLRLP
jgi:arylsulfatase A-like enzyme